MNKEELKQFKNVKNSDGGYVYVLLANDNTVKIGITVHPITRVRQIENASGKSINDYCISNPCSNYMEIEKDMHKKFKKYRLEGEWFNCSFQKAEEQLKNYKTIKIKNKSALDRCEEEFKAISFVKSYLEEFKYKEYNELSFKYDLSKWDNNVDDVNKIKNMIEENINYNIKETGNDAEDFNQYLYKYRENIKNNIKVRESIQEYCMDYINDLQEDSFAKQILIENKDYELFVRILGIQEIIRNYIVEQIVNKLMNNIILEFPEEYEQLIKKYRTRIEGAK
ncbi:GIY-YIG nuclease family protein [Clostridium beijerinckii]|uniref:GIY-YIG nuclease family protein n=1 Tax=Clostridium beijerinckii TaxID=1520 RepID=UPI00156D45D6|nr:GIY-YIG nuclease family protein [Clostridium beijerinckii]NRU52589.1 hypothetical protein [Clostridium beijerinckii]NYC68632.1 hypothetical protein [Clostridium beijerinckii]NYC91790.1 hypothetical protein [Clostridium beijerinckii]